MAKFLFSYRTVDRPDTLAPWLAWFDSMDASLVDQGLPVTRSSPLGNLGADTRLGGYSVVTADSLEAAVAIAQGCPILAQGGGVEVGEVADLDPGAQLTGTS